MIRKLAPELMLLAGCAIFIANIDKIDPIVHTGILLVMLAGFVRDGGTLDFIAKRIKARKQKADHQ